jgi:hypothetical protein
MVLLARGGLGEPDGPGTLVVDLLDRLDHQLDAEPVVDEVVTRPGDRVRERVVGQEPDDRLRQGDRVVVLDEQPGDAVLDHLRDPPDVRCDHRPRQGNRLEDREALGLAPRREHGDIECGCHRRDVVAPAGEDHPVGDLVGRGPLLEEVPPTALANDQEVGARDLAEDVRPGFDQRLMALLRLEPRHDTDDLRARLHAVFLVERAARLLVVIPLEVDPVVDQPDRSSGPMLVGDLALDRLRDRDQLVHRRRQLADELAVLGRSDPGGVNGRDNVRPPMSTLLEGERGLGAHDVSPVHVGVDHVGPDQRQVGRHRADRVGVIGLVDDGDVEAGPLELADGTPRRQRHDRCLIAGPVETAEEREEMLLGAAVRAGCEDLDDADARRTGHREVLERGEARVPGDGRAHQRLGSRASSRRTSRRWIGSSVEPHSYL